MQTLNTYIKDKSIEHTESCKYLGVIIDNHLKWNSHTDEVYNKIIKFTSILHKIRSVLPNQALRNL